MSYDRDYKESTALNFFISSGTGITKMQNHRQVFVSKTKKKKCYYSILIFILFLSFICRNPFSEDPWLVLISSFQKLFL